MFLIGPAIAFAVVVCLIAVLRWAFDTKPELPARTSASSDDFGLLAVAGTAATMGEARLAQATLADAGIRATTAANAAGQVRILVFPSSLDEARRIISGSTL